MIRLYSSNIVVEILLDIYVGSQVFGGLWIGVLFHLGHLWTLVLFGVGGGVDMYEGLTCILVVVVINLILDLVWLLWCFCDVCIKCVVLVFQCVVLCLVRGVWLVLCMLWSREGSIL